MKGLKFISAFALVLGLAACDNYDLPNPPGQTYPQPDGYLTDSDLQIAIAPEAINLVQANEANIEPTVATIEQLDNFPAEYSLSVYMEVASNDSFNPSAVIATTVNGNNISVNPDALNGAIQQAITKKPGTYTINARYIAYATLGSTNLRIGGLDATYGNGTIDVTTLNAAKDIEDAYYLVPCGADGTPDFAKAVEMNNTAGNVSGYDNPEFAIQIDVPETEDYFFMIASASAYEAKDAAALYGCNPAEDNLSGKLSVGSKVGELPLKGSVLITINMEQDSYSVNFAFANIFPISGSTAVNNSMWLYTDNFINYYGVTAINQRWTIYTQADKQGVKFTANPDVEPIVSENGFEQSGEIMMATDNSSISAPVKANTLYYVDVNLVQNTYTMKALTTLGIVGNHNGWNEKESLPLTPSRDLKTWTATDVELDGEFKINANGAWDYDFGGAAVETSNGAHVYNLQFKGGNMSIEKGTYDVKVDFSTMPYVMTITKK